MKKILLVTLSLSCFLFAGCSTKSSSIGNKISNNEKKKETNKIRDNSSVNIIYYDENMFKNYKEDVSDSYLFEKESNGTCLLISNINSLSLKIPMLMMKLRIGSTHVGRNQQNVVC